MKTTFRFVRFAFFSLIFFYDETGTRTTTSFYLWMMSALIPIDIVIPHSINSYLEGAV